MPNPRGKRISPFPKALRGKHLGELRSHRSRQKRNVGENGIPATSGPTMPAQSMETCSMKQGVERIEGGGDMFGLGRLETEIAAGLSGYHPARIERKGSAQEGEGTAKTPYKALTTEKEKENKRVHDRKPEGSIPLSYHLRMEKRYDMLRLRLSRVCPISGG